MSFWDTLKQLWAPPVKYKNVYINVGAYSVRFKFKNNKIVLKRYEGYAYWLPSEGIQVNCINYHDINKLAAREGINRLYVTQSYGVGIIWDDSHDRGYPRQDLEVIDLGDMLEHWVKVSVPENFQDPMFLSEQEFLTRA